MIVVYCHYGGSCTACTIQTPLVAVLDIADLAAWAHRNASERREKGNLGSQLLYDGAAEE
jgi:hypothetical protein